MTKKWQLMNGSDRLIKDVRMLNLPPEITEQALRLIEQAELPVVFWPNANLDRNTGAPNRRNPYQFWITIKAGTTESEAARLVLSLLNYSIQHRRRCMVSVPKKDYLDALQGDSDREDMLQVLADSVTSFCMSLENEFRLQTKGIYTAPEVRQYKVDQTKKSLLAYIEKQRQIPFFHWYPENEASNLIEYAACSRYSREDAQWFRGMALRMLPPNHAQRYYETLCAIERMVDDIRLRFDGINNEDIINSAEQQLIDILNVGSMLELKTFDAYQSTRSVEGQIKHIYTFVPEGIENERLALKGVRAANECLGLLYEASYLDERNPYAKITISSDSGMNMSAYDDFEGNHYILLYLDFLLALEKAVEVHQFSSECAQIEQRRGCEQTRERLFRYAIFFATLHEYGHILHGDCKAPPLSETDLLQREAKANAFAEKYFNYVLLFQYRPDNSETFVVLCEEDKALAEEAKTVIRNLRIQYG